MCFFIKFQGFILFVKTKFTLVWYPCAGEPISPADTGVWRDDAVMNNGGTHEG